MGALIEEWKQLKPLPTISREQERAMLIEALRRLGNIVELVAGVGIGMTLLKRLALDAEQPSGGRASISSAARPSFERG